MSASKHALFWPAAAVGMAAPWASGAYEQASSQEKLVNQILRDAARTKPGDAVMPQTKTANPLGTSMGRGLLEALKSVGSKVQLNPLKTIGGVAGLGALGYLASPTLEAVGEKIKDTVVPTNLQDTMLNAGAENFAKSIGSEGGKVLGELVRGIGGAGFDAAKGFGQGFAQRGVFKDLAANDDILSQADPSSLQDSYHTMVRFAPTLATDPNAVRSFLRESVLYGSGPNVASIKQLADAERASQGD